MRDDGVRYRLEQLAGREICPDCADAFEAILDAVRAHRACAVDATEGAANDSGRPS